MRNLILEPEWSEEVEGSGTKGGQRDAGGADHRRDRLTCWKTGLGTGFVPVNRNTLWFFHTF